MRMNSDIDGRAALWIGIVAAASIAFSWALACVTPFAAIATVCGVYLPRRLALLTTGVAWLANQAVGYLVLGYPMTWDSLAWGVAIGVAALLATFVAGLAQDRIASRLWTLIGAFAAAVLIFEGVLYAATAILPSGGDAFSLAVMALVLRINLLAFAGLWLLHSAAIALGLLSKPAAKALPA